MKTKSKIAAWLKSVYLVLLCGIDKAERRVDNELCKRQETRGQRRRQWRQAWQARHENN